MNKNKQVLAIYLFLAVITLLAFRQVVHYEFVNYDDNEYVTDNHPIQNGITTDGLIWAFTTYHAANWHPLTWISHMLDIQFFGLNPQRHHLTNLLFHMANVLLLFFVLHQMTKALWQSAFVAVLFALHPLHVESVAWISERKDVLSTFFWMLTLVAYCYYAQRPCCKNYLVVIALFALGLMAKPMLATLPFVLLLLDYWPLGRFEGTRFEYGELHQRPGKSVQAIREGPTRDVPARKKKVKAGNRAPQTIETGKPQNHEAPWASVGPLVLEKIPLFVLTAISCAVTFIAQNEAGTVASIKAFTPNVRIANAFVSYVIYIVKTIWPDNLAVFYPYPGLWPLWQVLGAVLLLVTVTFAVISAAKRFPYLPVGWLWFTGTLVPVIGIVQVGGQAMADRYMYIPSIGLFIVAAWGIPEILKKRRYEKQLLGAAAASCLLCLSILTQTQVGYWRDSITLFDHTLSVTKNNVPIYNNRGNALHHLGDQERAIEDFSRAIEINPLFAAAYNGRGLSYNSMGNFTRALEDFGKALEINPLYAEVYNSRGLVHNRMSNYRAAIEDFDRAIRINPGLAAVYNNRGNARDDLGDHVQAIEDYSRAIEIDPGYADAYSNRGIAYNSMGNYGRAVEDFDRAIAINPRSAGAYYYRGKTHASLGNEAKSVEDLKAAARLGFMDAGEALKSQGLDW